MIYQTAKLPMILNDNRKSFQLLETC